MTKPLMLSIALLSVCPTVFADKLSCREEAGTYQTICYDPHELRRTSDGNIRTFALYDGGPKGVRRTSMTGVVSCREYYLELRDRQGVAYARDIARKRHVREFIEDICAETKVKIDPTIR